MLAGVTQEDYVENRLIRELLHHAQSEVLAIYQAVLDGGGGGVNFSTNKILIYSSNNRIFMQLRKWVGR